MIVTSSSYLEKLSTLLMMVGRSAPRYQSMALLYPRSKELQDHLFEYFIVVVHLCHRILKFSQKSKFEQMASSLSDVELKNYQPQLELWANMIKEDVNSLMAKSIEDECRENSRFRALSSMSSKSISLHRKMKAKLRVLDSCSTYDYQTAWKQIRKVGNATLFNRDPEYRAWKCSTTSCTLVYTGKLGSGKSVLMANMVDDLHLLRSNNIPVAYFFCRHDLLESLIARTVIGCLARQILVMIPDLANDARSLNDTCATLDIKGILELLRRTLSPDMAAYFVLDGLDECSTQEKETVMRQLRILQDEFRLLICVSLRLEPETTLELKLEDYRAIRTITIPEANPDLEAFIEVELASCVESRKLTLGDPTLIMEIQDALVRGSQGMFLWVALQIEALCAMKTDDAIRRALADLPKDLSETYSRILRRVEEPGRNYQQPILELVLVAYRPLTTEELREALSVTPGDTTWNPAKLINGIYSTLACCGGLITIDEEESTVRLVHHSVKQFLLSGLKYSIDMEFTTDRANRTMADIIVTYLSYDVFETQLSAAILPQILSGSAPSRIIRSTIGSSGGVRDLALKLLKSRKLPDFDISRALADTSNFHTPRLVDEFHFFVYAKSYWLQHISCISEQEPIMYRLLLGLLRGNVISANAIVEDGRTPLSRAAGSGHKAAVKVLLDSGKVEADSKDNDGRTPLWWAVRDGHEAVVKLLLDTGKVDADSKDSNGRTPLSWAAHYGHEAVVKLLLDTGKVDADSKDSYRRMPLSRAAQNGHEAVVKLLLDTGKVDADSKDSYGRTPLLRAAEYGHEAVVKLLLDTGKVDTDSDSYTRTPLSLAAEYGHEAVVKLLLDTGKVDADSKGSYGRTPLSQAAHFGHEAVVKLLLDTGKVDADSKHSDGRTPLLRAVQNRHEAVVKLLLDTGKVDADSKDTWGQTPLSWAAQYGHEAVVKLLLDTSKVDVNSEDKYGWTPLSRAAKNGNEAVVKLLQSSVAV